VTPLMPYIHRVPDGPASETPTSQQGASATTKLLPAGLAK